MGSDHLKLVIPEDRQRFTLGLVSDCFIIRLDLMINTTKYLSQVQTLALEQRRVSEVDE
jgi:hypothetical protein